MVEMAGAMKLLELNELIALYGPGYVARIGPEWGGQESMDLDRSLVPRVLWPLIPYSQFWDISDDCYREDLIHDASEAARIHLKNVVDEFEDQLDEWLAGSESESPEPTKEYISFSAMVMAAL